MGSKIKDKILGDSLNNHDSLNMQCRSPMASQGKFRMKSPELMKVT